jgi:hypothetical protein
MLLASRGKLFSVNFGKSKKPADQAVAAFCGRDRAQPMGRVRTARRCCIPRRRCPVRRLSELVGGLADRAANAADQMGDRGFESGLPQRRVTCEPGFSGGHPIDAPPATDRPSGTGVRGAAEPGAAGIPAMPVAGGVARGSLPQAGRGQRGGSCGTACRRYPKAPPFLAINSSNPSETDPTCRGWGLPLSRMATR